MKHGAAPTNRVLRFDCGQAAPFEPLEPRALLATDLLATFAPPASPSVSHMVDVAAPPPGAHAIRSPAPAPIRLVQPGPDPAAPAHPTVDSNKSDLSALGAGLVRFLAIIVIVPSGWTVNILISDEFLYPWRLPQAGGSDDGGFLVFTSCETHAVNIWIDRPSHEGPALPNIAITIRT